jgi:hypothetical protein
LAAFALYRRSLRVEIQKAEPRRGRVVDLPATRASVLPNESITYFQEDSRVNLLIG